MNLEDKLDKIRRKPEHVRIRYAWIFSFVITFFVVIIWAVSLMTQKNDNAAAPILPDTNAITNDLNQQKDSIQNAAGNLQQSLQNNTDPNAAQNSSVIDPSASSSPDGTDSLYDNSANDSTATDGTDNSDLPVDNSVDNSSTAPSGNAAVKANNNPTQNPAATNTAPATGKEGFKEQ